MCSIQSVLANNMEKNASTSVRIGKWCVWSQGRDFVQQVPVPHDVLPRHAAPQRLLRRPALAGRRAPPRALPLALRLRLRHRHRSVLSCFLHKLSPGTLRKFHVIIILSSVTLEQFSFSVAIFTWRCLIDSHILPDTLLQNLALQF